MPADQEKLTSMRKGFNLPLLEHKVSNRKQRFLIKPRFRRLF